MQWVKTVHSLLFFGVISRGTCRSLVQDAAIFKLAFMASKNWEELKNPTWMGIEEMKGGKIGKYFTLSYLHKAKPNACSCGIALSPVFICREKPKWRQLELTIDLDWSY